MLNWREHWQSVYSQKPDDQTSWHQTDPQPSLQLILDAMRGGRVIDIGGGASVLVDRLIGLRFTRIAVLDISSAALNRAKVRLGEAADWVEWIAADVTAVENLGQFDLWHDRAVFHFLTDPRDRKEYVALARRTVSVGGHLVIGTFATDGPDKCSGLDVCRYDADSLRDEFGDGFKLAGELKHTHLTPWGTRQPFFYGTFRRTGDFDAAAEVVRRARDAGAIPR